MIPHLTIRVQAAQARTRIRALAVDTSLVLRTIIVDNTLWSAVWRGPDHFWKTGALAAVADNSWWVSV